MARIINTLTADCSPEHFVLNAEKWFDEHPLQDSEIILSKTGFGRKIDLYIGYDEVDDDKEAGEQREYYIEIWNNFGNDEPFELGGCDPIETWYFSEETSKEDRISMLLDALDEMTKQIYKVVEDYEGGYTLK